MKHEKFQKKQKFLVWQKKFIDLGAKSTVIKCGSEGCYVKVCKDKEGYMIPAFKNVKVVDITGVGDSFCSGFLADLSKGMDFNLCING